VGAPLAGRVLIVDDVITAGTSCANRWISYAPQGRPGRRAGGARPAGTRLGSETASAEVTRLLGIPVLSIAGWTSCCATR
jgi:hypothetical protein